MRTLIEKINMTYLNNVEVTIEKVQEKEYSILEDKNIEVNYISAMIIDSNNEIQYLSKGQDVKEAIENLGKEITSVILSKRTNHAY